MGTENNLKGEKTHDEVMKQRKATKGILSKLPITVVKARTHGSVKRTMTEKVQRMPPTSRKSMKPLQTLVITRIKLARLTGQAKSTLLASGSRALF